MTKIHIINEIPQFFQEVWDMKRKCEFRLNDHNFKVGDIIRLIETDIKRMTTGREVAVKITHIQKLHEVPGLIIELYPKQWLGLSIEPISVIQEEVLMKNYDDDTIPINSVFDVYKALKESIQN